MAKIAAITGAASGIGQAACQRLLGSGWMVFGLDNARARLDTVAEGFGAYKGRFRPVLCDVADASRVAAAFQDIGPVLNALVTCAGVLRTALMEDMTIEDFDLVLNVNTRGTFLCAQKALPLLRAGATPDNPSRVVCCPRSRHCDRKSSAEPMPRRRPRSANCAGSWPPSGRRLVCWSTLWRPERWTRRWSRRWRIHWRRKAIGRPACRRWAVSPNRTTSSM